MRRIRRDCIRLSASMLIRVGRRRRRRRRKGRRGRMVGLCVGLRIVLLGLFFGMLRRGMGTIRGRRRREIWGKFVAGMLARFRRRI